MIYLFSLTKLDDAAPTPKESPTDGTMERHSARQKEKVDTQHDAEYFDMPVENIQVRFSHIY